jgi:hypothetical protein
VKLPGFNLLFVLLFLLPVLAHAEMDGNQLLKECINAVKVADGDGSQLQPDQLISSVHCTAYIEGYHAATALLGEIPGNKAYYCLPDAGLPPEQSARMLVKWLKEHPEHLNEPASSLMAYTFSMAFPCKLQPEKPEKPAPPKQVL